MDTEERHARRVDRVLKALAKEPKTVEQVALEAKVSKPLVLEALRCAVVAGLAKCAKINVKERGPKPMGFHL